MDMIFTASQLQEKSHDQSQPLCMTFIDLTKPFDSVKEWALRHGFTKTGCQE